jgi:CelD/BcsL family acetyltransferase involved in cellulose biosynthesis
MVRFQVVRQIRELEKHELAWASLCDRAAGQIFTRPEWLLPWLSSFGKKLTLAVVLGWYEGELVAVLPFHQPRRRALSLLCNDHTPEGQLAIDPAHHRRVIADFVAWAFERRWSHVELNKLPTDSVDYRALQRMRALAYERRERQSHHTRIEGDFASFVAARSKNFRKQVKKAERAAKQQGLTVELLEEPKAIDAALDDLETVSHASWQGKSGTGAFAEPRAAEFYRGSALAYAQRGATVLLVCKRQGEPIGFILHVLDGSRMDALKSEFDERYGDCMVGWQIAARAYQLAHARGLKTIGMGCWRTDFKRRWTTTTTPVADLTLFAPTLVGGARFLYPHLSKELVKRALGKPSVARCLPLLDFTAP